MFLVLVNMILVCIISILFFSISFKKKLDTETFSSYECGFNNISKTREFFSFRFFLISVLFLIFDVEIVLMLPLPFLVLNNFSSNIIYFFISVLSIGLIYEYFYGSLNWLNFISKA